MFHTGQWNCDTPQSTHWRRLWPVLENVTQISADTQWCCGTYVDHVVTGL